MKIRIVFLILIISLIISMNVPILKRFTITDEESYTVLIDKAENYREFYISYNHSVNRTPVNEYYRIDDGTFILDKATFYSYGAGMSETGEYGSANPVVVNNMVLIDDIDKEFKRFTVYAGVFANHCLNTGSKKIYFSQIVKPQTSVTFEVKKVSLYQILKSR